MAMRRSSRAPKPIERYGPPVETIFVEEEDEGGARTTPDAHAHMHH